MIPKDTENTAHVFIYSRTDITIAPSLGVVHIIAEDTQRLTGCHKTFGTASPPDSYGGRL